MHLQLGSSRSLLRIAVEKVARIGRLMVVACRQLCCAALRTLNCQKRDARFCRLICHSSLVSLGKEKEVVSRYGLFDTV